MNLYLEAATPSRFELPTMKRHEFDFNVPDRSPSPLFLINSCRMKDQ